MRDRDYSGRVRAGIFRNTSDPKVSLQMSLPQETATKLNVLLRESLKSSLVALQHVDIVSVLQVNGVLLEIRHAVSKETIAFIPANSTELERTLTSLLATFQNAEVVLHSQRICEVKDCVWPSGARLRLMEKEVLMCFNHFLEYETEKRRGGSATAHN